MQLPRRKNRGSARPLEVAAPGAALPGASDSKEALALMALLNLGEEDRRAGRVKPVRAVIERLRAARRK
jgi:hypothetical protein